MDVPYSKSGASSRAHYQIVRDVENNPNRSEKLLRQEVERIRQRFTSKLLSTSELRKDLIVLLYCLNSSVGSVNSKTLAFALPSAVHLAEAASRVSEKRIGYLFCWEVMPREYELQLMLVNTIRKDLTSSSIANINLALESLVNLPSMDVIPAVHTRCVELLSHPSAGIRMLAMKVLQSFAQFTPDLLRDENIKRLVVKRFEDADEGVVRAAFSLSLTLLESDTLESEEIMRACITLISRFSDKHSAKSRSHTFILSILSVTSNLYDKEEAKVKSDHANELLPSIFTIFRRSVRHDQRPLILECFRLLGRLPVSSVADYIVKMSTTSPALSHPQEGASDRPQAQFVHPVARIRHFLSSRTLNDHYLFLSCLVCLDPSLWAGIPQPSQNLLGPAEGEQKREEDVSVAETSGIPPVLDQLEVERVLSFLESEDEQIRALTLRILISLDPTLVETCYMRALEGLKVSSSSDPPSSHARNALVRRSIELASTVSLGNEQLDLESRGRVFVGKLREVVNAASAVDKANEAIVEFVLTRLRRDQIAMQRSCILSLLSLLRTDEAVDQPAAQSMHSTLFLILVALTCELAPIFGVSKPEVVSMICLFATTLHVSPLSAQELVLLCMTRLVALLSPPELVSLEMQDVQRVVHELGEASLTDKKSALVIKRCEQFERAFADPHSVRRLLDGGEHVSLPELAGLLDQADRRPSLFPVKPSEESSLPLSAPSSSEASSIKSPRLSQSRLRYDAYAPPPASSTRLLRVHSQSSVASSGRSSNRASSRASSTRRQEGENDTELSKTVTAGELTLAASRNEFTNHYRSEKGKMREIENATADMGLNGPQALAKTPPDLLIIDSPFLPEPLVDVNVNMDKSAPTSATVPTSSPFISASASLRTSPEPGRNFEVLWAALDAFSARGWCEDAVDVIVRKLQGLEMRMDVLDADLPPFEGDLKISLHVASESLPCVVLRMHEESDGSFLWQVRSRDREVGLKMKELMR